jgi:hypothetical protein
MGAVKVAPLFRVAPTMSQAATSEAVQIGSKVRITRVRDRIPAELVDLLKADPSGVVKGFRTVDGQGIGVVVQLSGNQTAWFFEDEIALA